MFHSLNATQTTVKVKIVGMHEGLLSIGFICIKKGYGQYWFYLLDNSLIKMYIFQDGNITNAWWTIATRKRTFIKIVHKNIEKNIIKKVITFCQPIKSNVYCGQKINSLTIQCLFLGNWQISFSYWLASHVLWFNYATFFQALKEMFNWEKKQIINLE